MEKRDYLGNLSTYWSANFFALVALVDLILLTCFHIIPRIFCGVAFPNIFFANNTFLRLTIILMVFPFSIPIVSILKSTDIKKDARLIILGFVFSTLLLSIGVYEFIKVMSEPGGGDVLLFLIVIPFLFLSYIFSLIIVPLAIILDIKKGSVVPNKKLTENELYQTIVTDLFFCFWVLYILSLFIIF